MFFVIVIIVSLSKVSILNERIIPNLYLYLLYLSIVHTVRFRFTSRQVRFIIKRNCFPTISFYILWLFYISIVLILLVPLVPRWRWRWRWRWRICTDPEEKAVLELLLASSSNKIPATASPKREREGTQGHHRYLWETCITEQHRSIYCSIPLH